MSSNIFVKSDVKSVVETTELDTEFPAWLTVAVTEQQGGALNSETSDVFMSQINNTEVNNLVNMITSIDNQAAESVVGAQQIRKSIKTNSCW